MDEKKPEEVKPATVEIPLKWEEHEAPMFHRNGGEFILLGNGNVVKVEVVKPEEALRGKEQ